MTLRSSTLPMVGKTLTKFVTPDVSASKTAAQNWTALTAAADRCALLDASDGGYHSIWVPPGSYNMDAAAGYTGRMRLYAIPGTVKFIVAFGKHAINLNQVSLASGPYTVSAIAEAVHPDVSGQDAYGYTHRLTFSTVAEAANFQRGDAIHISSEDARTYYTNNVISYPMGTVNYLAESAVVESIDTTNGYVYLAAPLYLWSLFVTNIRARRLNRDGSDCEINGIDFDTATDPIAELDTANGGYPIINFRGVVRPHVRNCRFFRSHHTCIEFYTCFKGIAENCQVRYAPTGSDHYGYGTAVQGASYGCIIRNNIYEHMRHGVTVDGYSGTSAYSSSAWWQYGDVRGTVVTNCQAIAGTGSGFDTHEPSIDTAFIACSVIDAHRPSHGTAGAQSTLITSSASPGLFTIRGRADTLSGCYGSNNQFGLIIMSPGIQHEMIAGEGTGSENKPGRVTVSNCVFKTAIYMNNNINYGISIWGNASITAANQVCVDFIDVYNEGYSRGVEIRAGVNNRVTFMGGKIGAYDENMTISGNGAYTFIGTYFSEHMKRSSEQAISIGNSSTCVLTMVNVVIDPLTTSTWITSSAGVNATLRHANIINRNTAATITLTGGTGTITKTGLVALT